MSLRNKALMIISAAAFVATILLYIIFQTISDNRPEASPLLMILAAAVISVGFAGVVLITVERLVFARLSRLIEFTHDMSVRVDLSTRLEERPGKAGQDEIATLSHSMNTMLAALQDAQKDIRMNEARLSGVIKRIPVILVTFDSQGVYTLMEGQGLEAFNLAPGQLVGQSLFYVYRDNDSLIASARRVLNGEEVRDTLEVNEQTFEAWYTPTYDKYGKVNGGLSIIVDITERIKTEEALRAAKEAAESANHAKSTFLASMSHELRTPLNAIIGFIDLMLMNESLNEKNSHRAQRIRTNGAHLLELINDVLDLSRIEAGRMTLVNDDVDLKDALSDLLNRITASAKEKSITFKHSIRPELPKVIQADEDALVKVVTHLLTNAVKFTHEGTIDLNIGRDDDYLTITVTDTGIGIPSHMHETIFESFRQVDQSSTRAYGGTGLGLAIVHHLCMAMNGTITLESEVGSGSTFMVRLPLLHETVTQ